jgi:two-component system NtrC family sensor kinase
LNFNNQRKSTKRLARANDQITSANHELNERREEITAQRDQLADTITDLKAAQQQLIQSGKMASLGELTAGIAHEIQNPLNFVNNFSEVNTELIDELQTELERGDLEEVKNIAADIQENEKKINMYGKRADSIVKGMLEHSRASTGQKELTDLNKLADEYLRLAYHGLRAKDKSFNAGLITNFAESLPLVNVIPQDIGRVLFNLFNNAFYAVYQKQKSVDVDYKPTVEISTATNHGQVQIIVKDNGSGVPENIKDKIMKPFFTTKPNGEGTGLSLSLSYIVVKGHGGNIALNSKEGEGAEFTITLLIT